MMLEFQSMVEFGERVSVEVPGTPSVLMSAARSEWIVGHSGKAAEHGFGDHSCEVRITSS